MQSYKIQSYAFYFITVIIIVAMVRWCRSLNCFACTFTYTNSLSISANDDGWCVNDSLLSVPEDQVIRPCAPWEKYCSTTIVTMLKSFTSISRQCAETCSKGCEASGYGQDHISCTDCCEKDKCNKNFELDYYVGVMAQQFTSWTKPVKNEAKTNAKKHFKFPY